MKKNGDYDRTKAKDIADIRETMQICKNEYEDYFHRFDVIKRQAVTKENWDKIQKKLQKLEKEKEDIFQNIQQARDTKQSLKKNFEILQKLLGNWRRKLNHRQPDNAHLKNLERHMQSMRKIIRSFRNMKEKKND